MPSKVCLRVSLKLYQRMAAGHVEPARRRIRRLAEDGVLPESDSRGWRKKRTSFAAPNVPAVGMPLSDSKAADEEALAVVAVDVAVRTRPPSHCSLSLLRRGRASSVNVFAFRRVVERRVQRVDVRREADAGRR